MTVAQRAPAIDGLGAAAAAAASQLADDSDAPDQYGSDDDSDVGFHRKSRRPPRRAAPLRASNAGRAAPGPLLHRHEVVHRSVPA